MGPYICIGLGLFGVGLAVHAVLTGTINVLLTRLGGWASISSTFSRDEEPVRFWCGVLAYGIGGLGLALFALYHVLVH
jgi:hypothetical protein